MATHSWQIIDGRFVLCLIKSSGFDVHVRICDGCNATTCTDTTIESDIGMRERAAIHKSWLSCEQIYFTLCAVCLFPQFSIFFFCRKKKFPPFFPSRIAIVFDWKRFSRRNIQTMAWLEYFATWNSFKANFYGQFINVCVEWFLKFDERKWVREQCARWNEMNHHNALKWINSHFLFKEKEK